MANVLIIHHGSSVGGGLIALLGLIEELKLDNNVSVFCIFDGVAVSYIKKLGVKVITPKSSFYKKLYSIFIHSDASYFSLVEQISKLKTLITFFLNKYIFACKALEVHMEDVDIVYLNSTFISDWAYAAKKFNKKVIIHIREPLSKNLIGQSIIRMNIKKYCDKIIAISKDNSKRINLALKTSIIYDPVVIKNRNGLISVKVDEKFKYFVYVGGEARIKGFEQFVKSLIYLNDDIRIFFLGNEVNYNNTPLKRLLRGFVDPFALKHEKLQKELKASSNIIHVGLTDNLFSYFNICRFLISPFSKPHASLPVLEAFSCGLPVIVSDVVGMDEHVNKNNGIFFKNNSPKSLAKQINFASNIDNKHYELLKKGSAYTYSSIKKKEVDINKIIKSL